MPLILDECVTDLKVIVRAWNDQAADVIDLKIAKLGGISKAKEAVDFCSKMGLAMTVVDAWGSKHFRVPNIRTNQKESFHFHKEHSN